jgi:hypothetical protein
MVLFGGEVLRGFSLALLIGVTFGTYSSVAIASPIMVWWEQRIESANRAAALSLSRPLKGGGPAKSKTIGRDVVAARTKQSPRAGRV